MYAIAADQFRADTLLSPIRVEEAEAGAIRALIAQGRREVAERFDRTDRPLPT